MREIVHIQAGQCGNQIGAKVNIILVINVSTRRRLQVSAGVVQTWRIRLFNDIALSVAGFAILFPYAYGRFFFILLIIVIVFPPISINYLRCFFV